MTLTSPPAGSAPKAPPYLRPPIKIHGGKADLARRIVAEFPPHEAYVEPFLGGGSVLLNKPRAPEEHAGDLDGPLIDMWHHLREADPHFLRVITSLHYRPETFEWAASQLAASGIAECDRRARAVGRLVRGRFSQGGRGERFAWSDRLRGGRPGDENAWATFLRDDLERVCERARGVCFHRCDAHYLLDQCDDDGVLFYLDPPYLPTTRTARDVYEHEMTEGDHEELLRRIARCRGMVAISGYRNDLYDARLRGWRRAEWKVPNNAAHGKVKQGRVECLWMNY